MCPYSCYHLHIMNVSSEVAPLDLLLISPEFVEIILIEEYIVRNIIESHISYPETELMIIPPLFNWHLDVFKCGIS